MQDNGAEVTDKVMLSSLFKYMQSRGYITALTALFQKTDPSIGYTCNTTVIDLRSIPLAPG